MERMSSRAGTPATPSDLIDVEALLHAYWKQHPDVNDPEQKVVFGTSGHRGSSLKSAFNDDHIAAITQAIVEDGLRDVRRAEASAVETYDFTGSYVSDLASIIDFDAIKRSGIRIGADPLGGASVGYWQAIADTYGLDLTVVNDRVDPTWA